MLSKVEEGAWVKSWNKNLHFPEFFMLFSHGKRWLNLWIFRKTCVFSVYLPGAWLFFYQNHVLLQFCVDQKCSKLVVLLVTVEGSSLIGFGWLHLLVWWYRQSSFVISLIFFFVFNFYFFFFLISFFLYLLISLFTSLFLVFFTLWLCLIDYICLFDDINAPHLLFLYFFSFCSFFLYLLIH